MPSYLYFWKPTESYGFLGNWYYSPFVKDEIPFINNEQYFMWAKQQLFDPTNVALEKKILETNSPKIMKDLGRLVRNFNQKEWDSQKYDIMKNGLIEKFSQNSELKILLLNTLNSILVEASPYDKIWGIGLTAKDAMTHKPWKGENLLGKALMDVRTIFQNIASHE
jgi:ribA/ribD-fused uncharacterized protein